MGITVVYNFASGGGILPKNAEIGSIVSLQASNGNPSSMYDWEFLSVPELSNVVIQAPNYQRTKVGPLDKEGDYLIRVCSNRDSEHPEFKTIAFSVPGSISPIPIATDPGYNHSTGRIRNGSFEIGIIGHPGWALHWNVERDDVGILNDPAAGITSGRCVPLNFQTDGTYCFVLGNDIFNDFPMVSGDMLEISQEVDFTNINNLKLELKFNLS